MSREVQVINAQHSEGRGARAGRGRARRRAAWLLAAALFAVAPAAAARQTPAPPQAPAPQSSTTPATTATPGQDVGAAGGAAPAQLPPAPPPIEPNFEAPPRPLPSAERVGVDLGEQTPLSLNEAVRLALENSNDIELSRDDVRVAEFDLRAARGVYDPVFSTESFFGRSVTPAASALAGGADGSLRQNTFTGGLRFGGYAPRFGGSYQLDFTSSRLTTNNQFVSLNPQFATSLTLTYTQPLWRGLRIDDNRRRIEVASKNLALTDAQFRQRTIEVITQVEQAYWDLAFALRNLQVQLDAVRQARTQVESNRRQVREGVLAPIDIVAAETQVTDFEQNVYGAQEAVTRAENNLKSLVARDRTSPLWSRPLVPTTPVALDPPRVALPEAVGAALRNRPELAQLETSAEINEINTRYFRDQTKPQLDLVGSYNPTGLSGSPAASGANPLTGSLGSITERLNELSELNNLPPLPPANPGGGAVRENLAGGYGRSLSNLFGQNYPSAQVGVRLTLPLRNSTAEANLGRSLAEGSQLATRRRQAEILIESDVRNTIQAARSAEARLASAAASRASAEQQYESERRKLQAGTSTVFLVLQRQTELVAARGRELQAQTDLNKSIASFRRATGGTLEANGVAVRERTKSEPFDIVAPPAGEASELTNIWGEPLRREGAATKEARPLIKKEAPSLLVKGDAARAFETTKAEGGRVAAGQPAGATGEVKADVSAEP